MNDQNLSELLGHAAGDDGSPVNAHADLTRGHRALARTRRRRGAVGLAGVAALGVVGVGAGRLAVDHRPATAGHGLDHTKAPHPSPKPTVTPSQATDKPTSGTHVEPVVLLAQPTDVGAITFDQVPQGWESQGPVGANDPVTQFLGTGLVTFATAGFPDQHPDNFEGKLVVMFDHLPPYGQQQQVDGRTVWVNTDGGDGYIGMSVQSRPGEPQGVLHIQYPDNTGWTQPDMIKFLNGIHLGPGAKPMNVS